MSIINYIIKKKYDDYCFTLILIEISKNNLNTQVDFVNHLLKKFINKNYNNNGYLYCLFNEMFKYYGDDVYKLGYCNNIEQRKKGYTTSYIKEIEFKYISGNIKYYEIAEHLLFKELKEYRISKDREFFKCNLDLIISKIKNISDLFKNENIVDIYRNNKLKMIKINNFEKSCLDVLNHYSNKLFYVIKINSIITKENKCLQSKIENKIVKINEMKKIINSEDINYDELEYLIHKQKTNEATSSDKLKIEKKTIKLHFGIDMLTSEFMNKFYGKTHILYNLIGLIDDRNINNYKIYEKFKRIDYNITKKVEKNNMISELIKILGYENIFDKKKIIKEQFIINTKKVLNESKFFKEPKYSLPLFGMTKIPNISSNKSFLGFLNSLLVNWSLTIRLFRKSTNNDKIKLSYYELIISENIDEFINYKIMKGFKLYNKNGLILNNETKWNNLILDPNQQINNKYLFI